jgi:hypothetical protein
MTKMENSTDTWRLNIGGAMSERPKLNFITYVFMMYQSGLMALGKIENPLMKKMSKEPEEAKGIIELLEVLEEKTKGNLTTEEEKTLKMVLDTLRFNYVEEAGKDTKSNTEIKPEPPEAEKKDGEDLEIH